MNREHVPVTSLDPPTDWQSYFEQLPADLKQFQAEAADYVARLTSVVTLAPTMRVLDFGCGLGFAAQLVAPRVATVGLWDLARRLLERATERVSRSGRVEVLDLSDGAPTPAARFDLILVNSVVQYMSEDEFRHALRLWGRLLRPEGRVVLSDIVPPHSRMVREIGDTLWFSLRRGVFFTSLGAMRREFRRYAAARRAAPLLRLTAAVVARMAHDAGLACGLLPANLTFRRNRLSFVLTGEPIV